MLVEDKTMAESDRYVLHSLDGALKILSSFSMEQPEWGVSQLAAHLEMNKSTVHRLLRTLQSRGAVSQTPSGKYQLGMRIFELGNVYRSQIDVTSEARPILQGLASDVGMTSYLARLDSGKVYDVLQVQSPALVQVQIHPLMGREAISTAAGKVLLSELDGGELRDFVRIYGMPHSTFHTIGSFEGLKEQLREVRKKGYAFDDRELVDCLRSIAAPVRDHRDVIVFALGVTGTLSQLPLKSIHEIGNRVIQAAQRVSVQLGWNNGKRRASG